MNYLHSNFVAHCDIKPENIILTSEIDLQIADFSVACDLRGPNGDGKINPAQVRKKFWYDNATPSANSSLLRVFSSLYLLTEKECWLKEFKKARAGYPTLCHKAPQGIGHALSAIADNEIGLCKITCSPDQVEELMSEIAKNPYRVIFILASNDNDSDLSLSIGRGFNEKIEFPKDCIEKIFS